MKRSLVLFFNIVLVSISLQQSDIIRITPKNSTKSATSNNTLLNSLSNYKRDVASIVLDFLPYIGNIKNLGEAVLGFDLVTGKNLTNFERILSLICSIPFAYFLKGGKNYEVGHSFLQASKRAFAGGKMRNFIQFGKASKRAFAKQNTKQKIAKAGILIAKIVKSLSKIIKELKKIHLIR